MHEVVVLVLCVLGVPVVVSGPITLVDHLASRGRFQAGTKAKAERERGDYAASHLFCL